MFVTSSVFYGFIKPRGTNISSIYREIVLSGVNGASTVETCCILWRRVHRLLPMLILHVISFFIFCCKLFFTRLNIFHPVFTSTVIINHPCLTVGPQVCLSVFRYFSDSSLVFSSFFCSKLEHLKGIKMTLPDLREKSGFREKGFRFFCPFYWEILPKTFPRFCFWEELSTSLHFTNTTYLW